MTKQRKQALWLAVLAVAGWPVGRAAAQAAEPGATQTPQPTPPAPSAPAAADVPPAPAPVAPPAATEAPSAVDGAKPLADAAAATEAFPTVFAAPTRMKRIVKKREKPLQITVGMLPTSPDFGSEADLVSNIDEPVVQPPTKKWIYSIHGFFRAPVQVSYGPRADGTSGHELHSMSYYSQSAALTQPHVVGGFSDDWNYIGLTPSPTASLYLTATNGKVSGNIVFAASTFSDSGYKDLDQMGGVSQAYVTVTWPTAFGLNGGMAWNVGAFSNRYGTAGPNQNSTGYYGTYLFGRLQVVGEALTADIDLNDHLELVLEHGVGAKLEVMPFLQTQPIAPYLPTQGPVPQGSNFVHHAHAALLVDKSVRIAGHYLTSWSTNDCPAFQTPCLNSAASNQFIQHSVGRPEAKVPRLTIVGGEVHVDGPSVGNGYLGYSYVKGQTLMPLSDGIQVIHGGTGYSFSQAYFGPLDPAQNQPGQIPDASGTVHTLLFQYLTPRIPILGPKRDLVFAAYGMYNHSSGEYVRASLPTTTLKQDKLKFGAEVEFAALQYLSVGARFDRVSPDGHNSDVGYSALSPRLIFHTNFLSKEYVLLNYTRYFLGSRAAPGVLFNNLAKADPNLFVLSAQVAF